jgi:hypothetical protein
LASGQFRNAGGIRQVSLEPSTNSCEIPLGILAATELRLGIYLMKIGQCCICGAEGVQLSFEHIPPRAAFNDQRIFEANIQGMVKGKWDGQSRPLQGQWVQGGAGKHTLCEKCNNDTGRWYGSVYVAMARQGLNLVIRSGGTASLAYPYRIFPLRILKQVTAMFCSACGPSLQKRFPDIPRFVLDRERRYLPYDMKVFAYLIHPSKSVGNRQSPMTGVLINAKQHLFAEIAFAPFGFVLTGDVTPVNYDLLDITHFGHSAFHHREAVYLKLPVLEVNTWLPGDFSSTEQIKRDLEANEVLGQVNLDPLS